MPPEMFKLSDGVPGIIVRGDAIDFDAVVEDSALDQLCSIGSIPTELREQTRAWARLTAIFTMIERFERDDVAGSGVTRRQRRQELQALRRQLKRGGAIDIDTWLRAELCAAYVAVARQLRANGYSPIPLSDKAPTIRAWPGVFCERLPSLQEIERDWSAGRRGRHEMIGVGVAAAASLVIVDIDDDAAVVRVLAIVPQACAAPACIGQRGRKIFLRAHDGRNIAERNVTGVATGGAVEVLSWHRLGVVPPTVHAKAARSYVWVDEQFTLLTVQLQDLPTISDREILQLHGEQQCGQASRHP